MCNTVCRVQVVVALSRRCNLRCGRLAGQSDRAGNKAFQEETKNSRSWSIGVDRKLLGWAEVFVPQVGHMRRSLLVYSGSGCPGLWVKLHCSAATYSSGDKSSSSISSGLLPILPRFRPCCSCSSTTNSRSFCLATTTASSTIRCITRYAGPSKFNWNIT